MMGRRRIESVDVAQRHFDARHGDSQPQPDVGRETVRPLIAIIGRRDDQVVDVLPAGQPIADAEPPVFPAAYELGCESCSIFVLILPFESRWLSGKYLEFKLN